MTARNPPPHSAPDPRPSTLDYFALLNEPRRPWLDPENLKGKFLALSAETHPDRVHNANADDRQAAQERYTLLNAAYNCLRDPKERLLHFLELERGAKPLQVQNIPSNLMELSLEVSRLCREADEVIAEKAKATSPLLQVQMFEQAQQSTEKLYGLQKNLGAQYDQFIEEVKKMDRQWQEFGDSASASRASTLDRLEQLLRLLSFFARWRGQIQERIVQLAF